MINLLSKQTQMIQEIIILTKEFNRKIQIKIHSSILEKSITIRFKKEQKAQQNYIIHITSMDFYKIKKLKNPKND